jgi:hypothetical protein
VGSAEQYCRFPGMARYCWWYFSAYLYRVVVVVGVVAAVVVVDDDAVDVVVVDDVVVVVVVVWASDDTVWRVVGFTCKLAGSRRTCTTANSQITWLGGDDSYRGGGRMCVTY